ncbi:PSD1 and planctomycete cytochrome C domain-containing protein [Novipirellula sp. SH528]|uniref:PSD1 and planctomycete cytochrome C domain-containing protein n=1 Tax=Novipirellula sp. SH528 TaxID=3454466 RepID=UPI003FA14230
MPIFMGVPKPLLVGCTTVWLICFVLTCLLVQQRSATATEPAESVSQSEIDFFESRIRPVLDEHCYSCHSSDSTIVQGGLLLDSREATHMGGDSGPAVVPGNVSESLLISAIQYDDFEMPPKQKLPQSVIDDFVTWIERGAVDPRAQAAVAPRPGIDPVAARDHWAFQSVVAPEVPQGEINHDDRDWVRNPIDAFVLAKLNDKGWRPAAKADKHTLLRRATFDLIGLPPSQSEIDAFLADDSPQSFQRVVDRLLASPHYGQRWGRHWLDLVRYADTNGADENHKMPHAWRYRDWVFDRLNEDQPLDEFIIHQLAGDLLPTDDEQINRERITATGMLVIGPKMLAEQDKEKMRIDIVDEQIDTVTRTMLGMTVACARCHDHKFDPISTEDYYALAGIFSSTRSMLHEDFVSKWMERDLPSKQIDERRSEHQKKIDLIRAVVERIVADANAAVLAKLGTETLPAKPEDQYPETTKKQLAEAKKTLADVEKAMPAYDVAMAVEEGSPTTLAVHIRGNHLSKGDAPVPRGVPQRLQSVAGLDTIADNESGRLNLARWLTSDDHPLTGRVMANRLWMWHFGQPLMGAPSNFGLQSEAPLHQDLLDWLSRRLIDDGWSLKRMHRMIMLSSTYQMRSDLADYSEDDPENEYLSHQNRRRLEIEPLRDAIHIAGDSLDRTFGGSPLDADAPRRSVYLLINRAALLDLFSTFDYVETANHIEQRPVTTVPNQALFLLNSNLVHQQAERLSASMLDHEDDEDRITHLWMKLYGRPPTEADIALCQEFIADAAQRLPDGASPQQAWSGLCRTLIAGSLFSYVD